MMPISTTRLRMPRIHRNTPDTDAPMIPVIECSSEPSSVHLAGQRLHARGQQEGEQEHDRRVPEGEPEPDRQRPPRTLGAVGEQLAGGVVDGGDVVGVERVPQPEGVGEDPDADRVDARLRRGRSAAGTTNANSTPKPTTCSSTMNPAIPAMDRRSCGVNVACIRDRTEPGAASDVAVTHPPRLL